VVVLPTPPLPEVTTMIFAITLTLCSSNSFRFVYRTRQPLTSTARTAGARRASGVM
jgi:hypothetical protein